MAKHEQNDQSVNLVREYIRRMDLDVHTPYGTYIRRMSVRRYTPYTLDTYAVWPCKSIRRMVSLNEQQLSRFRVSAQEIVMQRD
jgi:hypothetical protein